MPLAIRYLITVLVVALAACAKQEAAKPPEQIVNITAAAASRRDLAIVETAVGAETALGSALGYDPTRVGSGTSYVRLPFPEHVAAQLKVGQSVTMSNFATPEQAVQGRIREIRPGLNATTVSNEVIVTVPVNRRWRPEGSVRGEVTLGVRRQAVVVPEQAVVLRPAGSVVYVLDGETVKERKVALGIARGGIIEVTSGLTGNEMLAVDGASTLTDGAKVKVQGARS